MNTEIKIKLFNDKFDLFITLNNRVVHCETFKSVADIDQATPALLERVKQNFAAAEACELNLNEAVRSMK
jgi:hypothetical protein